jgi:ATP-dependent DNA helicase DinG
MSSKAKNHVGDINDIFESLSKKSNTTYREEQVDLSSCIYETLQGKGVSFFESPTGTGKTLAYLVAACQYVKETKNKVVIATTTRYLQTQARDDFESLLKPYYPDITLAILKGKTNYVSKKRIDAEMSLYKDADIIKLLKKLSDECDKVCGDATLLPQDIIDDIKKHDAIDIDALSIKNGDAGADHLHYYNAAKEAAKNANIVITNHHSFALHNLFTSKETEDNIDKDHDKKKVKDSKETKDKKKVKREIPFSEGKVIIDEAHDLERNVFSLNKKSIAYTTVKAAVLHLLNLMEDDREKNNNKGKGGITAKDIEEVKNQYNIIGKIIDNLRKDSQKDERDEILISESSSNISDLQQKAYNSIFDLNKTVGSSIAIAKKIKNNQALSHVMENLESYRKTLNEICHSIKNKIVDEMCFFVKFSDKEKFPSVYHVTANLYYKFNKIWKGYSSIILLSGTLTDENGKDFFRIKSDLYLSKLIQQIGIKYEKRYNGFNYKKKVTAYLYPKNFKYVYKNKNATDYCDTNDVIRKYVESIAPCITRIINSSERGVLVLTASHFEATLLEQELVHKNPKNNPKKNKNIMTYTPWVGVTLSEIIRQFEENKGVLISASIWTGVDIKDTISDLVITRIPNISPEDPIVKAEKIAKGKYYKGYSNFPKCRHKTFIRTRQGIGRLCRKETDEGNIHVLDARVTEDKEDYKHYINYLKKKFVVEKRK